MNNVENSSLNDIRFVIKRSGDKVPFEEEKIKNAIIKAMSSSGNVDEEMAEKIARLTKKGVFRNNKIVSY